MEKQPLVLEIEHRLHSSGLVFLLLATAFRLLWGYLSTGSIWLNDCQLLVISLLVACLLIGGCLIPRPWSYVVSFIAGGLAWLVAISLIPPSLWNQSSALRVDLPDWQVYVAMALAIAGFLLKAVMQLRWRRKLAGHGFQWMLDWAVDKPYYARLTTKRILANLGYQQ